MTAFEIQRPDGLRSKMILRRPSEQVLQINSGAAEKEFKVLRLTRSLGLATQTPYYLDRSGRIFSTPYLVIEYIDGKPKFLAAPRADFTVQLTKYLAMIHSADCSKQDISFLPRATNKYVETSWRQPTFALPALDVQDIRDKLEKVSSLAAQNKPSLLHGDYWPGNILWRDDALVAVIDWEDAQIGDPLIDFAISRLDILWIFGLESFHSFTRHYQVLMDIDYTNLPYWDLCAALRLARLVGDQLAEWTAFFGSYHRHDITEHSLRGHFQFFVSQALEKLSF